MFGSVPVISTRGQGAPASTASTPAPYSSPLMAGGQRPAGSGRGLDTMAAIIQAVTSLYTPGYNMMTKRLGLTPATQPQ